MVKQQKDGKKPKDIPSLIPHRVKKYVRRKITVGKEDIQVLEQAYKCRQNTLLIGPTGAGKTHAIRVVAKKLEIPYVRLNLNRMTTPEDFVGQWVPKKGGGYKWNDGILTRFMRHGGVVVVDEINAAPPEILFVLHSVTDDERQIVLTQKDGEVVKAHPDFWFVATMAPEYYGTKKLNQALKDRFEVVLQYPYDTNIERELLKDQWLVRASEELRAEEKIKTPVSTRMLLQFEKNQEIYGTELAVEMLISKFEAGEQKLVREILEPLILCKKEETRGYERDETASHIKSSRRNTSHKKMTPKEKLEGAYCPYGQSGDEEKYFKKIIQKNDFKRRDQIARLCKQLHLNIENQWKTHAKAGRISIKSALKAEKGTGTRIFKRCKPFRYQGANLLAIILVDGSGSMIGGKNSSPHKWALKLAWSLSEGFEKEECKALVLQFNTVCKLLKDLSGKLTHGFIPGGGTDPVQALHIAKLKLAEIGEANRELTPLVVILTDALYPITDKLLEAIEMLHKGGAKILEVKISNKELGAGEESKSYSEGRGESYDYIYNIGNPDELIHGLQEVLGDIEAKFLQSHTYS